MAQLCIVQARTQQRQRPVNDRLAQQIDREQRVHQPVAVVRQRGPAAAQQRHILRQIARLGRRGDAGETSREPEHVARPHRSAIGQKGRITGIAPEPVAAEEDDPVVDIGAGIVERCYRGRPRFPCGRRIERLAGGDIHPMRQRRIEPGTRVMRLALAEKRHGDPLALRGWQVAQRYDPGAMFCPQTRITEARAHEVDRKDEIDVGPPVRSLPSLPAALRLTAPDEMGEARALPTGGDGGGDVRIGAAVAVLVETGSAGPFWHAEFVRHDRDDAIEQADEIRDGGRVRLLVRLRRDAPSGVFTQGVDPGCSPCAVIVGERQAVEGTEHIETGDVPHRPEQQDIEHQPRAPGVLRRIDERMKPRGDLGRRRHRRHLPAARQRTEQPVQHCVRPRPHAPASRMAGQKKRAAEAALS